MCLLLKSRFTVTPQGRRVVPNFRRHGRKVETSLPTPQYLYNAQLAWVPLASKPPGAGSRLPTWPPKARGRVQVCPKSYEGLNPQLDKEPSSRKTARRSVEATSDGDSSQTYSSPVTNHSTSRPSAARGVVFSSMGDISARKPHSLSLLSNHQRHHWSPSANGSGVKKRADLTLGA